jgi:hypothetical protein
LTALMNCNQTIHTTNQLNHRIRLEFFIETTRCSRQEVPVDDRLKDG